DAAQRLELRRLALARRLLQHPQRGGEAVEHLAGALGHRAEVLRSLRDGAQPLAARRFVDLADAQRRATWQVLRIFRAFRRRNLLTGLLLRRRGQLFHRNLHRLRSLLFRRRRRRPGTRGFLLRRQRRRGRQLLADVYPTGDVEQLADGLVVLPVL